MNQKKALGRGLSALIPQKAEPAAALAQIPLDRIALNPYQPRKAFDEKAIDELTRSVNDPAAHAAYWKPAIGYLRTHMSPAYRAEAVDTAGPSSLVGVLP